MIKQIIFILVFLNRNIIEATISLKGRYSNNLNSANIVIPRKVNHSGDHISHNVTHHHNDTTDNVHYYIPINNETWHLELVPHKYFIAPHMIIERHKRDIRIRNYPSHNINCHYIGRIRGHPKSRVALSSCNGLAGHIKTENSEYFIEPSMNELNSSLNDGHPHLVFQRSAVPEKKKKHHHHRKKKKHSHSNCGTKEPKRRTETRIEWQPQGKVIVQGGRKVRRSFRNHKHRHHNHNHTLNHVQHLYDNNKRTKRSISRPRHVETLIVADSTMLQFHDDIEQYLLTIMNMVSSFYKDPTIGNAIEIVVVKMIYLEEDDESNPLLNLTDSAERNLNIFCNYQHKLNTENDNDAHHHDVAILITRRNICGNDCMTLGLANVGGMCRPKKSCSVNEDNGIMLSHTIAHELGHNFGMYHDTAKIGCHGRIGQIVHIMTPTFVADTIQVSWSNCSRKYITHFLDQGLGKCLDDTPTEIEYPYPDLPPGAMYNAELQCRLQFNITDEDIHVCSSQHEICSLLWCQVNGECVTNMRPTAPGTKCGKRKWCQNGQCVAIEDDPPVPVNGGWGNWSEWSECSRTCGGGVSIQYRECNNPAPANDGTFCIGERKRYLVCNKEKCPEGELSFRAIQCAQYNNETYQDAKYKWLPYFDKYNPCTLFCTDEDDTVIANWADTTADGTPCAIGTKNMCIDGICRKVGCDWIVDSTKKDDRCGICDGNDDLCEPIKDIFNENFNVTSEYVEILTIPGGARNIIINEIDKSPNFLSIYKANKTKNYLNGEMMISMSGEFIIAGAESMYDRENEKETIQIPGPIEHAISVYVFVRSENNSGISYEFTLPILNSTLISTYTWKLGDWTACSATCGGGLQYRMPLCLENQNEIINDEFCWSNSENSRPHQLNRICNIISCPAHWWIGPWQLCPVTCKHIGDPDPVRRRSVMCLDHNDIALPEIRCSNETRPIDTDSCDKGIPKCNVDDKRDIASNLV